MKIGDYETHPIADAFPLLVGEEYDRFKQDVMEGLRDRDVFLYEGKILDARNRYRACIDLGKQFVKQLRFVEFKGDPFGFVISRNLISRRHLNESQRALVACRLADMKPGRPGKSAKAGGFQLKQAAAADAFNVGASTIREARNILDKGVPEVVAAVERGDITVNAATSIVALAPEKQLELLRQALTGGNRRARSNIVRQKTKRKDADEDAVMVLARALMRTTTQLGGSVKMGRTETYDDGKTQSCELVVGFQGRQLLVNIDVSDEDDPELS